MTDDELNAAVARVEGWTTVTLNQAPRWVPPNAPPEFNLVACDFFPPPYATDWQWCGPLVEKYAITIGAIVDGTWVATAGDTLAGNEMTGSPQRAICLAVVAAHGEAA